MCGAVPQWMNDHFHLNWIRQIRVCSGKLDEFESCEVSIPIRGESQVKERKKCVDAVLFVCRFAGLFVRGQKDHNFCFLVKIQINSLLCKRFVALEWRGDKTWINGEEPRTVSDSSGPSSPARSGISVRLHGDQAESLVVPWMIF